MTDYIEGKRPIVEALREGVPVTQLLMADNVKKDSLIADIERKAKRLNVPIKLVARKKLDELSERGSHQGVMAATRPFQYAQPKDIIDAAEKAFKRTAAEYAEKQAAWEGTRKGQQPPKHAAGAEGRALIVILDHVTDAGNLGAIARSADAVGASGIIIPNKRAAGVTAATYKSSAGAISHMPVAQVSNIVGAIERLKKEGYWVAGASEKATEDLWHSNLQGRIALVMGSEGEGISRLVQENCDFFISLPQLGQVESLNVAQSATAIMYEWLRQNQ